MAKGGGRVRTSLPTSHHHISPDTGFYIPVLANGRNERNGLDSGDTVVNGPRPP